MSIRFRKSISLGSGIRLNVGKRGLGLSAGIKGARVGVGSRGAYSSVGLPGTGISSIKYYKTNKNHKEIKRNKTNSLISMAIILAVVGVFSINTPLGAVFILASLICFFYNIFSKKQRVLRLKSKLRNELLSKNLEASKKLANKLESINVSDPEKCLVLALYYHQIGEYEKAIFYWGEGLPFYDNSIEYRLLYSNSLFENSNYEKVVNLLQRLTPEDEELKPSFYNLLGQCFFKLGKNDIAIETYKKGGISKRNMTDDLVELHYNLAESYMLRGDRENAMKHYNKIAAFNIEYKDVREKVR